MISYLFIIIITYYSCYSNTNPIFIMVFIGNSIYEQETSEVNSPISLAFTNKGLHGVTVIIQSIGGSLSGDYTISVSDSDTNFITLRTVSLGTGTSCDNSFSVDNASVFGNILHFNHIR